MRVLLWLLGLDVFLKSDDALARSLPVSALPLPADQLELVTATAEAAAVDGAPQTEPQLPPGRPALPHPIARQLIVQRRLRRGPQRKQAKPPAQPKRRSATAAVRRSSPLVNRPTQRAKPPSAKKRRPPRRHVWLSTRH